MNYLLGFVNEQLSEANHFHYYVFGETLEKLLNNFADKYGLYINKD